MAFVRAEAEAVNCGNDHKTRNEAEAATWIIRANLNLLPEIGPEPQWPPAIGGGAILGRKLPSENAPAFIGMRETSFFCHQRVYRRT
jgi:hypothetical protein